MVTYGMHKIMCVSFVVIETVIGFLLCLVC